MIKLAVGTQQKALPLHDARRLRSLWDMLKFDAPDFLWLTKEIGRLSALLNDPSKAESQRGDENKKKIYKYSRTMTQNLPHLAYRCAVCKSKE
jgi:hypothetical protein